MAAGSIVHPDVGNICIESLSSIHEIQLLYIKREHESMSVLAVVQEKDFAVERRIYDRQLEILAACPDSKLELRVISLRGRKLEDVISTTGALVPLLRERGAIVA